MNMERPFLKLQITTPHSLGSLIFYHGNQNENRLSQKSQSPTRRQACLVDDASFHPDKKNQAETYHFLATKSVCFG